MVESQSQQKFVINEEQQQKRLEESVPFLLAYEEINQYDLRKKFPCKITSKNKQYMYKWSEIGKDNNIKQIPDLIFAKYSKINPSALKNNIQTQLKISIENTIYQYNNIEQNQNQNFIIEWYVNFADSNLFGFYGSDLFAQDEIQTSEHPILYHLKEYLLKHSNQNFKPKTKDKNHEPTPCLIRNAQRMCLLKTDINPEQDRPDGLYGKNFAKASEKALKKAFTKIEASNPNPTNNKQNSINVQLSNIIAMAALGYGRGQYTNEQISIAFSIAFTSFRAAVYESIKQQKQQLALQKNYEESQKQQKKNQVVKQSNQNELKEEEKNQLEIGINQEPPVQLNVIIHTGNWGCGVFGNNKTFIYVIQMLSAALAEVNQIVFHLLSKEDLKFFKDAIDIYQRLISNKNIILKKEVFIVEELLKEKFTWGQGDGN